MKRTTKIYLLESNSERVYDEFSIEDRQLRDTTATKTLLKTQEAGEDRVVPASTYPVAIVFEHSYKAEADHEIDSKEIYAAPVLGYELLQQLEGRLLDYVDATYADKEQRQAQKKIISRTLHEFRKMASKHNEVKFGWAATPKPVE